MEKNKILIIAAHPDDEILGVGGTAAKLSEEGNKVFCLILSEGIEARGGSEVETKKESLRKQAEKASNIIGFKEIYFENMPDNKFDSIPMLEIVKKVEAYVDKIKPDIIYTHHERDLNIDHQKTFKAVITACRPCNPHCPKKIYSFEVLSSTEWQSKDKKNIFLPTNYVDIAKTINKKLKAMEEYKSEIREYPHSRSLGGIEALAKYRGMEAGLKYAEAFTLVRSIKK